MFKYEHLLSVFIPRFDLSDWIVKREVAKWLSSEANKEQSLQLGKPPACTSLLDGFGDSPDLGANSMETRWELNGNTPQRVSYKLPSRWQSAARPTRGEGDFWMILYKFFSKGRQVK